MIVSFISFFAFIIMALPIIAHSYEVVEISDGGHHIIDYILDAQVYVDRYSPGVGTQLELVDGGGIAPGEDYGTLAVFQ